MQGELMLSLKLSPTQACSSPCVCVRGRGKCSVVAKHDAVGYEPELDTYKMDLVFLL